MEAVRELAGRANGEKRLSLSGGTAAYAGYRWIFFHGENADWTRFSDVCQESENLNSLLEDFPPCKEKKEEREDHSDHGERAPLREGRNVLSFASCVIELTRVERVEEADAETIYVDADACEKGLAVRPRTAGDRIALPAGHRKVKELLIDAKIAQSRRATIPVVLLGEEILWVAGVRRSTLAYVTEDTKGIVRLKLLWEKSR